LGKGETFLSLPSDHILASALFTWQARFG